MVKSAEKDTESKILQAAKKVFILKGLDGARMQEIADEAGINKALLHYYFRSKDQLFMMIFKKEISNFFPRIMPFIKSKELDFEGKIRVFVENYIDIFIANPFLPVFVIREVNRNPMVVKDFFTEMDFDIRQVRSTMLEFASQLGYTPREATQLIVSIISMCVFPFAARPIIEHVLFDGNANELDIFLQERKRYATEFIISSITQKRSLKNSNHSANETKS